MAGAPAPGVQVVPIGPAGVQADQLWPGRGAGAVAMGFSHRQLGGRRGAGALDAPAAPGFEKLGTLSAVSVFQPCLLVGLVEWVDVPHHLTQRWCIWRGDAFEFLDQLL